MRGIVTLAAALALPLTTNAGAPLPFRAEIILISFSVILATLVVQGLSLAPLIRALRLEDDTRTLEGEEMRAREHALDLAFLDVSMPRLNGIEALKLIRKRWPNLPVVVVTAYGTIRLAVEAMKEGAVDFITKPFEQGQIDQTVSTFIDRMGQRVEITKLMGEITHDVKNLLMPLVTGTDLLADEIDDVFRHLPAMERSRAEQSHSNCEEVITMFRNTSRRIQDRMCRALGHRPDLIGDLDILRQIEIVAAVLQG